ncbi:hypothetical protein, partial [Sphingobium agri]
MATIIHHDDAYETGGSAMRKKSAIYHPISTALPRPHWSSNALTQSTAFFARCCGGIPASICFC